MDSVRFGRALGAGARSAARALMTAAEAASAPNPNPTREGARTATSESRGPSASGRETPGPGAPANLVPDRVADQAAGRGAAKTTAAPVLPSAMLAAAKAAARASVETRQTRVKIARGGRRFGEAVWGPLAKLSGVLWLEMTGAFFAIFAIFGAESLWRHRADLHTTALNRTAHQQALVYMAMTVIFTYFTVTSFTRAWRKSR